MSSTTFNPQNFGLKRDYLYEVLATTFSITEEKEIVKPNTSCMGIRLIDNNIIKISPYSDTTTCKNLKSNRLVIINFVGDVELFALAALKEPDSPISLKEFPIMYYNYKKILIPSDDNLETTAILLPYINKAWAVFYCKVIEENRIVKKDGLGEVEITEFKLKIIFSDKLEESFKLFNRAENLALETIVLATRLKVAIKIGDQSMIDIIHERITEYLNIVKKIGKNQKALKAVDIVNIYINKIMN